MACIIFTFAFLLFNFLWALLQCFACSRCSLSYLLLRFIRCLKLIAFSAAKGYSLLQLTQKYKIQGERR